MDAAFPWMSHMAAVCEAPHEKSRRKVGHQAGAPQGPLKFFPLWYQESFARVQLFCQILKNTHAEITIGL